MNIDEIIGSYSPYPKPQPKEAGWVSSPKLSRIPFLMDMQGNFIPEFQKFFNDRVSAIFSRDEDSLYEMSDKVLPRECFHYFLETSGLLSTIQALIGLDKNSWNIDVELDVDRLQDEFRNIVGAFKVSYYCITYRQDELRSYVSFQQRLTKLLFSYKNNRFYIISKFEPFLDYKD